MVNQSGVAPKFDEIEAKNCVQALNLEYLVIGDYMVIVRSDFDAILDGEMFIALMILYNVKSGKFVARVWNETVTSGNIHTQEDFSQACRDHFHFKPCIGIAGMPEDPTFLSSKRRFSKSCHR